MCCIFTVLWFLGPRFAILMWYLLQPLRWQTTFTTWVWPLLGSIFLPWATLMYVLVAPGGLVFFDWLLIAVAVVADIASYGGGGYGNRRRFGYSR